MELIDTNLVIFFVQNYSRNGSLMRPNAGIKSFDTEADFY